MRPGPKHGNAPNDALTRQRQIVDAQVAESYPTFDRRLGFGT